MADQPRGGSSQQRAAGASQRVAAAKRLEGWPPHKMQRPTPEARWQVRRAKMRAPQAYGADA